MLKMVSGEHRTISIRNDTFLELVRIKYARGFDNYDDVIKDLLDDEIVELNINVE
jgi:predicted CopG family antitoxin